jgi:hypothetical protein
LLLALVSTLSKDDLPAFGKPTNPISAITSNSTPILNDSPASPV